MTSEERKRGLGSLRPGRRGYSDEELLAEVRRVAEVVNKPTLMWTDFLRHGRIDPSALWRRFGGWWDALELAGLGDLKFNRTIYSDEELLAEVRRVAEVVNKPTLMWTDFLRHARMDPSTPRRRFGGWGSILEAAGLGNLYSRAPNAYRKFPNLSAEQLIQMMRELADEDGGLARSQFMEVTGVGYSLIQRRFGGWRKAMASAGLRVSRSYPKRYTDEYCYRNIFDLWMHYGRRPSYALLNRPPSRVSGPTYANRWNGWSNAFAVFLEWANSDEAKRLEWGWDELAGFGRKPDDE